MFQKLVFSLFKGNSYFRHCEEQSNETIYAFSMDCFASLPMTYGNYAHKDGKQTSETSPLLFNIFFMKKVLILVMCFSVSFNIYSQNESTKDKTIDFNKSFNSFGFSFSNGINFAPKLEIPYGDKEPIGEIRPILYNSYFIPEFTLQYSCMIKNGFGFSLEVPFGIFLRKSLTKLSDYGAPDDIYLEMGSQYIGFTGKLFVFKELKQNIGMQVELGIKYLPFYYPADQWLLSDYYDIVDLANGLEMIGIGFDVPENNSGVNFPKIEQKYYYVPDATAAVQFFFHGKKNQRNAFVVGLHANLSFVDRIKVYYDTRFCYSPLTTERSMGSYGWNSSSIGISVGYRFFSKI